MNHADSFFLREQKRRMAYDAKKAAIEASRDPDSQFLFVTALCVGAILAATMTIQGIGR